MVTLEWSRINETTVVGRITAAQDFQTVIETYIPFAKVSLGALRRVFGDGFQTGDRGRAKLRSSFRNGEPFRCNGRSAHHRERHFPFSLFYRLNVFPIRASALRERPEDIPLLVRHFVQQCSRRMNKSIDTIPSEIMTALVRYPWPGNVRELQNVIERAVIVSTGAVLNLSMEEPQLSVNGAPVISQGNGNLRATLEETERQEILAALERTVGKIAGPNGAAALLGMSRSTLQSRMQKLGISVLRTATCS
jgi:hypothetical protein